MATLVQIPCQLLTNKTIASSSSSAIHLQRLMGSTRSNYTRFTVRAVKGKTEEIKNPSSEDITKKYGLEAGLFKVLFFQFFSPFTIFSVLSWLDLGGFCVPF